ncbi:Ppx/GppA family phosphatase [Paracoccus sp. 1_MG-2023]|uniref:Ppx/GppA family phosphatase n=1 Tax=unclassified Paracoccus (in: a-proteobacteria) TaxID=2688777 RepID=UPI001C0A3B63|nr:MULTISPECIES: Ppx/GppA family phosphatase [unclassified Paracoccus (in: a-proteobacteria)]MBU2956695.1 Ppx/GppA family phosphatase [Paracoccus sp. C2R09]MDO6669265.1 Ppx/GppA family phosphatase [Paracoccus sp. 1_MG-2023]
MNGVRTSSGHKIDPFGPKFRKLPKRALKRVGVVDVGSNSVRLVVFDGAARSPAYFYNEKVMAGLGQDMARTGRLNPQGMERAWAALSRFAALAKAMDIEPLTCVATAAMREAEDGPAFREKIEKRLGLKIWVIDGEEEARLSAQGVLLGWPEAKGLVCDIGGNSMELAEVANGAIGKRTTSQLGPFRLQQIEEDDLSGHIDGILDTLADQMGTDHKRIYLVGGSWRAIARLDMERVGYPLSVLHEYRMTPEAVRETIKWIGKSDLQELRSQTGISSSRMELVPLAARVLGRMIDRFQPEELDVSSYGIREGLLYEHMSTTLRRRDPLLEAARFTEKQMARTPGFGKKLYHFLLPLFPSIAPDRDRLMRAACLLHDTAWRTHPDYRAEACFDNVTRANMAALSHPERVYLGLALLHRYKNSRAKSRFAPLFDLLPEADIAEAEILGKAMRFGSMFATDDPIDAGALRLKDGGTKLELKLTAAGRALMGEVAQSRFQSLCKSMGVEGSIA